MENFTVIIEYASNMKEQKLVQAKTKKEALLKVWNSLDRKNYVASLEVLNN